MQNIWIEYLRINIIPVSYTINFVDIMKKVDIPQVLISTAAIFGIGLIWYDFNVKVFNTVRDLLNATIFDPDAEEETDK